MGAESDRYNPRTEKIIRVDDSMVEEIAEVTGKSDTPAAPTGDGTMIAIQKAIRDSIAAGIAVPGVAMEATLAALSAKFSSLGQKTMANSAPVVIASDQTEIDILAHDGDSYPMMSDTGGKLLVSNEHAVLQASFTYGVDPDDVVTTVANGGAVTQTGAMASLSSGTAINGSAKVHSKRMVTYRIGQTLVFRLNGSFAAGVTGANQEMGCGNDVHGTVFTYQGATFGILVRINSVEAFVPQSDWNRDTMDGNGPSGVTLNPTYQNTYHILLFGAVRYYVTLPTGKLQLVHVLETPNTSAATSALNPNFEVRAAVVKTSGATDVALRVFSMLGGVLGNHSPSNLKFFAAGRDGVTVGSTEIPILAIRNEATYKTIPNKTLANVYGIPFSVASKRTVIRLYRAPDATGVTGGTFAATGTNSSCTVNTTATAVTTTGWRLLDYIPVEANISDQALTAKIENGQAELVPGEVLIVTAQTSGTNATVSAGIKWTEQR